ncbi:unnamed protein product, partial [Mesorhabditis belari]|uniref:Uncharacterized protein n=1 Tax=Mesorhabditis belari TaxID=2138241 RepID=A0AAF3E9R4_9BILA
MFTRFHIPLENTITATLYVAVQKAMPIIEIGLTLNRVFAVFFDGRLFNRVEKLALPYILVTYIAYFVAFGSTISLDYHYNYIPQSHREYYYDPLLYRVKSATKRGLIVGGDGKSDLFYFDNIPTQTLPYAVLLDVWVLLKILEVKKNSKATTNAGLRLIIMSLLTHMISMIPYIGRDLVGEDPDNSIFFFGDFWNFIATEMVTTFCQILLNNTTCNGDACYYLYFSYSKALYQSCVIGMMSYWKPGCHLADTHMYGENKETPYPVYLCICRNEDYCNEERPRLMRNAKKATFGKKSYELALREDVSCQKYRLRQSSEGDFAVVQIGKIGDEGFPTCKAIGSAMLSTGNNTLRAHNDGGWIFGEWIGNRANDSELLPISEEMIWDGKLP